MTEPEVVPSGSTIGILGGGQLGRMLALAAARLGMKTHIYCPDPESPAFEVTPHRTIAAYDDERALDDFAAAVDLVTYEFENVPEPTAAFLAARKPLAPGVRALAVSQDRIAEKQFLAGSGIGIAAFRPVLTLDDLRAALDAIGLPAVLKTARFGYDGKGQRRIEDGSDIDSAFAALAGSPLVLEAFVPFEREISVIVARNAAGEIRDYDAAENVHRNHILDTSTVPAAIDEPTARKAGGIAHQIAGALDYVGVMGIEFFVVPGTPHPGLLVNEIAPRVHNSGHWTEAVCLTDQFEQHIRAICNWPLGDPRRLADVQMRNLIGDDLSAIGATLRPGMQPHVYGKSQARPGRKMGHINRVEL
jgi:5-(carboxyamino)imidazole ribonucleotide synthase